jgi:hypothetical protein
MTVIVPLSQHVGEVQSLREQRYGTVGNSRIRGLFSQVMYDEPLIHGNVYLKHLKEVTLIKRKYLHSEPDTLVCEGLTHSDYTVSWPELDPSGTGIGTRIAKGYMGINIQIGKVAMTIDYDCILIGGDTIAEPNFAHWMFEHMPKLIGIELINSRLLDLPIVVSSRIPMRYLDWAKAAVGRELNFITLDLTNPVKFLSTWLVRCPAYRDREMRPTVWEIGYQMLRSRLSLRRYNNPWHEQSRRNPYRLYIPRRRPSWRTAINELDIASLTGDLLDTSEFNPRSLSVDQQIQQIAAAEFILLFGGADGAILQFASTRAIVIEIVAPNHAAFFTSMVHCKLNGSSYHRIVGKRIPSATQTGPHPLDVDYVVDLDELRAALLRCVELLK